MTDILTPPSEAETLITDMMDTAIDHDLHGACAVNTWSSSDPEAASGGRTITRWEITMKDGSTARVTIETTEGADQ